MNKIHLPDQALASLTAAAAAGREAWKNGAIEEAETHFLRAWDVLPDPKLENDYAQSLSWGMVSFYLDTKQYGKAKQWLETVREAFSPGPDPSVEFLAGTVAFDSGDIDEAFRLFHQLYLEYHARPFEGKDRKYLDFYKQRAAAEKR